MPAAHLDDTRTRYLAALLASYGILRLPIRSGERDLPLQTIFQPLTLRHSPFSFENQGGKEEAEIITARNGTEALARSTSRRMIVLGGPGMGKTTLLKALLQQAIQNAQSDQQEPLPIFVSLPDLARSGLALETYLPGVLSELNIVGGYAEILVDAVREGRAFLCLDSLDEVVPARRPDMIAWINREALRCGGTWIIGSRFTEYKGGQFLHSQFAEWELQPLDEQMRLDLARHLFAALAASQEQTPTPSAENFIQDLEQDTRLSAWGENPLLFSLTAMVYARAGMLPGCRAALYRDIVAIMIAARAPDPREATELLALLANVALQLYQTSGRNFTVSELFKLLTEHDPASSFQDQTALVARILDSGLLDVVAHETYGFKHQMFQEYLAAVALARRLTDPREAERNAAWEFAWRKHTYSRWSEILRLCVGVLSQEHGAEGSQVAARWLRRLATERDTPTGDVGNLCLELALGSLREFSPDQLTGGLAQIAQALVLAWAELLARQDNMRLSRLAEDIRMLDLSLVLPAIVRLEDTGDHDYEDRDSEQVHGEISALFREQNIAVPARVLTHAYPNSRGISFYSCTLPAILQEHASQESVIRLLLDRAEHWQMRAGAATLLGEWKEQAPINILCQVLEDTTSYYEIRLAALEALGKQEERFPIARLVPLLQDRDERVRVALIETLGQRLPIETMLALLDDTEQVRTAVLDILAKLDEPADIELESCLRMLQDENVDRREAALYLLGSRATIEQLQAAMYAGSSAAFHVASTLGERFPTTILLELLKHRGPDLDRPGRSEEDHNTYYALREMLQQPGRSISSAELSAFARESGMLSYALDIARARHIALPIDLLLDALNIEDYFILYNATHLLAEMGANAPVAALLDILQDTTSLARLGAAKALRLLAAHVPIETEPIFRLLQELKVPSHGNDYDSRNIREIYNYLLICLMCSKVTVPVEFLLNILKDERRSPYGKNEIVAALENLGEQAPIDALLRMVPDNVEGYGWRSNGPAIPALSHLYLWITPEILQATSRQRRIEDEKLALKVLALSGKDVPVDLIKSILDDSSRDCYLRMEARQTLHAAGVHLPLRYFLAEMGIGHEYSDYVTVESVHELGSQAPIEELLRLLILNYDGISGVNYNGLEIASLLKEWGLRDRWIYETVVEALRESTPFVPLEPLIAALEHRNRLVRERAVRVLGAFGERAPIDRLVAFMEKYGVQQALLETFAELRSYIPIQVMETAINKFKQQEEYVPFWPLEPWGRDLPLEPLLTLANDREYDQYDEAIAALGWLQDRAPRDFLLKLLESEDEEEAKNAITALSRMGKYAPLDALLAHLYNEDGDMRADMIDTLGDMGEYAPLEVILQALDNEDPDVRRYAKYPLDDIAEAAPARFVEAARNDRRPPVREALMAAIAKLGKDAPLEIALTALDDENEDVRFAARKALVELDVDVALLPLEPLLDALREKHGKHDSHWTELELLTKFGTQAPIEPILALLGDSKIEICERAAKALYKTHPEQFAEVARQAEAILRGEPTGGVFESRVQSRVADRVRGIGRATPAVLEMIADLLDWPYWEVRMKAAQALGAVHRNIPDRAIQRLLELRQDPDSRAVREAADDALFEILSRENGMEEEE